MIPVDQDAERVVGRAGGGEHIVFEVDAPVGSTVEHEVESAGGERATLNGEKAHGVVGPGVGELIGPAGSEAPRREVGRGGVEVELHVDERGRIADGAEEDGERRGRGRRRARGLN